MSTETPQSAHYDPTTHDTTTFTMGDDTFTCLLITDEDRLLCPKDRCRDRFDAEMGVRQHLKFAHGQSNMETRVCPHCCEDFRVKNWRDKTYCSKSCANSQPDKYETVRCPTCETLFDALKSEERVYCSEECCNNRGMNRY